MMLVLVSSVQVFVTTWSVACQAPLCMEFSRHGILPWWRLDFYVLRFNLLQTVYVLTLSCCCWITKLCPTLLQPPWTVACQASLSVRFPRQEYWSGLPLSRGSSWPRDWTHVSYVDRQVLYYWIPFDQMSGHPVAQSSRHIKLTIQSPKY